MAFKMSVQKSSGKISEVVIGTGEKAIKTRWRECIAIL